MVGNTAVTEKESEVMKSDGEIIVDPPPVKEATEKLMNFSPAESLESNITLVSGGVTSSEANNKNTETAPKTYQVPKIQSVKHDEVKGTTEKVYVDGRSEVCYPNGNRKEISADGRTVKVIYYNGDLKENLPSGLVKYFYSQTKTWHLTYPDGKEVLQFSKYCLFLIKNCLIKKKMCYDSLLFSVVRRRSATLTALCKYLSPTAPLRRLRSTGRKACRSPMGRKSLSSKMETELCS